VDTTPEPLEMQGPQTSHELLRFYSSGEIIYFETNFVLLKPAYQLLPKRRCEYYIGVGTAQNSLYFARTMPEPGPDVPLSVAVLKDGDGGEVSIPSTWRDSIQASDAETETVEITTANQRWVVGTRTNFKKKNQKQSKVKQALGLSVSLCAP
jgi:hypothetical protein